MTSVELRSFLLWSTVINYGILLLWFVALIVGHDALYRIHTRWFKLTPEAFDVVHYGGMAIYKVGILCSTSRRSWRC